MLHIEGMGVTGSLLAWHLHHIQEPFTWSDSSQLVNAWGACTGAIYPADELDMECHAEWDQWLGQGWLPHQCFEQGTYVFNHKKPPHGGRYEVLRRGGLGVAHFPSFHLNAQRLVPFTQERFKAYRRQSYVDHPGSVRVVAHGFGRRLHHVYWGWTRLVELSFKAGFTVHGRPAFYFRDGRFIMAYAYPAPGTDLWYAGSSIIKQMKPARLEMEKKYERWRKNFERLGHNNVKVRRAHEFLEGWRPAPADDSEPWAVRTDNVIEVKPLWNSGVRHFPKVLQAVMEALK